MAQKEQWASRLGLVLAMAGNAVGLGNFLRFPAQAGANGGGAFLIPYFVALLVVGLPLIWVEWAMGRFGGQQGHHSAPGVFQAHGKNPIWKYGGVLGLWSCLVIASYYLYIETWCMAYAGYALFGGFADKSPSQVAGFLGSLTGEKDYQVFAFSWWGMILFAVCISVNIYILSRGLAKGIELVCKIGMPLLILFAAILAVRGLLIDPATDPEAVDSPITGLNFVWEPRFDKLSDPAVWLAAAGQIFFTLSIGMGSIHCYASYLREKDDVALTGSTAAWTNEFCEVVLGGTILIPIAVAYLGLGAVQDMTGGGSGFGLGFVVFPTLFNKWGAFAPVAGFLWFGLLFFAAITSSLAMGQPIMAFLQQEFGFKREKSALAFGLLLLPLALPVALLHSNLFFDEFDYWAGTVMLVVFALIEAILFAWVFGMERGWQEINNGGEIRIPRLFFPVIKYVTPAFLLVILVGFVFKPAAGWNTYLSAPFSDTPAPAWAWADDSMIGKIQHVDVVSAREGKLKKIDGQIADVQLSGAELTKRLASFDEDREKVAKNEQMTDRERTAQLKSIEAKKKEFADNANLPAEQKQENLKKLQETREQAESFYETMPWWRNINRLAMIGAYLFFCVLVWIAWSRRRNPLLQGQDGGAA